MADEQPREITTAPSAKRRARAEQAHRDADARRIEEHSHHIAAELRRMGAAVIACADDSQRERARAAGRRAGRIINRSVRTKVLADGRVGVWDNERRDHPLHSQLDRTRGNKLLEESGVFKGIVPPHIGPRGEGPP